MGMIKHSILRAGSVFCVFLVVGLIVWLGYVGLWKPVMKPNPSTATSQKAESIINNYVNPSTDEIAKVIKDNKESAFELNLFPPKIKIGGFKLSIFK